MWIAGEASDAPAWDDVVNPATGVAFATCPRGRTEHVDRAVGAAAAAYGSWKLDEALRRRMLVECAEAIEARARDIATLLTREQGKPLAISTFEAMGAAAWLRYFATTEFAPEVIQDDAGKRIRVHRRPLGVVAAITPWNYPIVLLAWKLAPALRAGNTIVAKPSPFTPLSTLLFVEILSGIVPKGVVNAVTGDGPLGSELCRHREVRKISFTGSVATGKKIHAYANEDLKRVTLELGGNDPAIVLDDADPEPLVEKLFWAAFTNSGQICSATKRLYVHESLYPRIVAGLAARARATRLGDGLDPATELGPINNAMQLDKLIDLVEDAKRAGGVIHSGGERTAGRGYFYPPTIVTDIGHGTRLVDEEQFGTALPVLPYRDLDEAVAAANDTMFGLGASVWTSDPARGEEVAAQLDVGSAWVNCHLDVTPMTPFGGCKMSGLGTENGRWGYDEFTQLQIINASL
jgi:acyl-CoA reductase-like NAD-dependent aldehyde dehydrogenase